MHKFTLHKDDLVTITQFLNKYPDVSFEAPLSSEYLLEEYSHIQVVRLVLSL